MTPRQLGESGEFCWMDLKTHDPSGTAAFFSAVLGWDFAVDGNDWREAVKVSAGGHRIGGVSDLTGPLYPAGLPAHIAFYLAVEDVDAAMDRALGAGARLVLAPFDAGDQGRIATLIDPVGAVFSLWRTDETNRWSPAAGVPEDMILACTDPGQARDFYAAMLGTAPDRTRFVSAHGPEASAPRWELAVVADDLDVVAALALDHGREARGERDHDGRPSLRLSSPEGLTFHVRPRAPGPVTGDA
ncbi:VOC family protein [Streptomyces atroolivaceus]|uniref:VOC family protein n=1 Tax=Streptomyces atroolivaceus TaxID=66869 RepID=UPI002024E2A3|nr:VOC family protein [Streptomyces atroolivaceus]